jgi:hypothetical protein
MIGVPALLIAAAAAAQPLTICADRPGKSSQTCIVPPGHFQLEIGIGDWTLAKSGGERDTALALGQLAIKYGLTGRSHIEVDVTPWQRVTRRAAGIRESDSGVGDLLVVYKYLLTGAGAPLQVAVSPFVKAPIARRPIGNRRWEGGLVVPIQYAIPRSALAVTLAPELDWAADGDGRGHHALTAQVANLGWQATPALNLSGEIWAQWDWDPSGTERQASADVAASYLASDRVQLDAGGNFGLNRATPDVELYGGVSVLF